MNTRRFGVLLVAATITGCASHNQKSAEDPGSRTPTSAAIVFKGSELNGNLLDALRLRVPMMRVITGPGECPRIMFRGLRTLRDQPNPTVYMDGTRMADTCILQQVLGSDIDSVEIYTSGNTPRSTYQRNPSGLILIFRRKE